MAITDLLCQSTRIYQPGGGVLNRGYLSQKHATAFREPSRRVLEPWRHEFQRALETLVSESPGDMLQS